VAQQLREAEAQRGVCHAPGQPPPGQQRQRGQQDQYRDQRGQCATKTPTSLASPHTGNQERLRRPVTAALAHAATARRSSRRRTRSGGTRIRRIRPGRLARQRQQALTTGRHPAPGRAQADGWRPREISSASACCISAPTARKHAAQEPQRKQLDGIEGAQLLMVAPRLRSSAAWS